MIIQTNTTFIISYILFLNEYRQYLPFRWLRFIPSCLSILLLLIFMFDFKAWLFFLFLFWFWFNFLTLLWSNLFLFISVKLSVVNISAVYLRFVSLWDFRKVWTLFFRNHFFFFWFFRILNRIFVFAINNILIRLKILNNFLAALFLNYPLKLFLINSIPLVLINIWHLTLNNRLDHLIWKLLIRIITKSLFWFYFIYLLFLKSFKLLNQIHILISFWTLWSSHVF